MKRPTPAARAKMIRSIIDGKSYFCDRIQKGVSLKVIQPMTPENILLLTLLSDKINHVDWYGDSIPRFHFYGVKLPLGFRVGK